MGLEQITHTDGTVENKWTPGTDGQIHVVQSGPISGSVILSDGTAYDVTPEHVQVDSPEHAAAVDFHIAKTHEATGRLGKIVHGEDYDGPPLTVTGDEASYSIAGV